MIVTRDNFEKLLPQIETELKNCVFIAIDCEFSGLVAKDTQRNSLFDTNDERYNKLKENMKSFIPIQVGISIFSFLSKENTYQSSTYTFFLLPKTFGFGDGISSTGAPGTITTATSDIYYLFQSTAVQFLCKHQFDFNKLFYEGINYLSIKQETEYKKELNDCKNNTESILFLQGIHESLCMDDESIVNCELNQILSWYNEQLTNNYVHNKNYIIQNEYLMNNSQLMYLLKTELKNRLITSNIEFYKDERGVVNIKLIETSVADNDKNKNIDLELELLNDYVGFTKVYKLIKKYNKLNKPICGHNIYLDILIIYQHFDNDLPNSYQEFKTKIHEALPNIYDTKYLSYQLLTLNFIPKHLKWQSNGLDVLYKYFKDDKGRHIVFSSPIIEFKNNESDTQHHQFHNAGFDSYCTGYCFIRLAHIFVGVHYETMTIDKTITSKEHLSIISKYKNCINLIRANISHIKLDGPDPISERPSCLYVKCKTNNLVVNNSNTKHLNVTNITNILGKYGSIDVQMLNKNEALVAVANHRSANDILKKCNKHHEYIITKYNPIKHSPLIKTYLWGSGCVVTTGLFMWTLYKIIKF